MFHFENDTKMVQKKNTRKTDNVALPFHDMRFNNHENVHNYFITMSDCRQI